MYLPKVDQSRTKNDMFMGISVNHCCLDLPVLTLVALFTGTQSLCPFVRELRKNVASHKHTYRSLLDIIPSNHVRILRNKEVLIRAHYNSASNIVVDFYLCMSEEILPFFPSYRSRSCFSGVERSSGHGGCFQIFHCPKPGHWKGWWRSVCACSISSFGIDISFLICSISEVSVG